MGFAFLILINNTKGNYSSPGALAVTVTFGVPAWMLLTAFLEWIF
jgi:hypothetical protein